MTRVEIEERLKELQEQQLELTSIMSTSDAHASKCIKLGLIFQESYPEDYRNYISAREQYNLNEEEIIYLENLDPDPEFNETDNM